MQINQNISSAAQGVDASEAINLEVLAPSAQMALERASIDTQVATAKAYPRSLQKFHKQAMEFVSIDAETAESCIYIRPVGKDRSGKMQYAEGASVRAAEIVAVCYGNLRVKSRIIEQTERYVKTEGMAYDVENNVAQSVERTDMTVKSDGTPFSESMRNVVALASLSKALRDATFRVVPRALCKKIMDRAKEASKGHGTLAERVKKAQAWVSSLKIDERRVLAVLGIPTWNECLPEHLDMINGLRTAMRDDNVPVDDAFPPLGAANLAAAAEKAAAEKAAASEAAASKTKRSKEPAKEPAKAKEEVKEPPKEPAKEDLKQPEKETAATSAPSEQPTTEQAGETIPTEAADLVQFIANKCRESDTPLSELIGFLHQAKVMRPEQKNLSELATTKLVQIAKSLGTIKDQLSKK